MLTDDSTVLRQKRCSEPYIHAYRFAAVTGLRPGEVLGLQRRDVKNDVYRIRRAINEYGEETSGKNDNAIRSGQLAACAVEIMRQQEAALRERGIVSPYVFPDTDGGPLSQK